MGKGRGKDIYQRINFLYQASYSILAKDPSNLELIKFYGKTIKMISQRTQIKLDPNIKRTICKKCHIILYPGISSIVRLKNKRAKHCVITCLHCGAVKRFLSKPDYELWYDKPESQISVEYLGKHISK